MTRALVAALAVAACGQPARLAEPVAHPAPWCFALVAEAYEVPHYSRACTDSAALCELARDRAVAFAGLAHFTEIGACRRDGGR